jgi:hypothetical protein
MDTGWTDVAANVTCDACRTAIRGGAREGVRAEEVSTRRSAPGTRPTSFALRYVAAALVAFVGAWSLPAVSGVLPAAGSRATAVALWLIVAILVLSGVACAALAGAELGIAMHRDSGQARGRPTR